jgi:hypothetical protein
MQLKQGKFDKPKFATDICYSASGPDKPDKNISVQIYAGFKTIRPLILFISNLFGRPPKNP